MSFTDIYIYIYIYVRMTIKYLCSDNGDSYES